MASVNPNDLLLFARVAEQGSFSRAAARVGLPKSTVSRRLAELEAQLGERLLLRTTRKLSLTEFGRTMLAHARQVAEEVEAASQLAQHRQAQPSGRLRMSMPADFANLVLEPVLVDFTSRYPSISLELDLTPRRVDLIGENFDLAIRMGELGDDASLAARRIAAFSCGLYASPSYLERRGKPPEPEALMEHDTLRLLGRTGDAVPWVLTRAPARWEGHPPSRIVANFPDFLLRAALRGAGIAPVAHHFAAPHVAAGTLVPVLPDWNLPSTDAWAVFPGRRLMPARTRAFLDVLAAELAGPRCQQAEATAREIRAAAAAR